MVILEPDLPIIDAHHHLGVRPAPDPAYPLEAYLADAASHNVVASCFVGDVEYGNSVGEAADYLDCRVAATIIGNGDLTIGDAIGDVLDRDMAIAPKRFRGVRSVAMHHPDPVTDHYWARLRRPPPPSGFFESPGFRPALKQIAQRKLIYEVAVFDFAIPEVAVAADLAPESPIVLVQLGQPMLADRDAAGRLEVLKRWKSHICELARRPNVICKIDGIGMLFWEFGFDLRTVKPDYLEVAEAWRPWVETAIEVFGPDRCMMGSNFPPDSVSCSYADLWNAFKHITRLHSATERASLFSGTAARTYGIGFDDQRFRPGAGRIGAAIAGGAIGTHDAR